MIAKQKLISFAYSIQAAACSVLLNGIPNEHWFRASFSFDAHNLCWMFSNCSRRSVRNHHAISSSVNAYMSIFLRRNLWTFFLTSAYSISLSRLWRNQAMRIVIRRRWMKISCKVYSDIVPSNQTILISSFLEFRFVSKKHMKSKWEKKNTNKHFQLL